MLTTSIPQNLVTEVLTYLHCKAVEPSLQSLNELVAAYTQVVPWESVFRIVKRYRTSNTIDCPRWPPEFWDDALSKGGGGTCFESNLAFFYLLRSLNYDAYLTINDIRDEIGGHTAIVVMLEGQKYLVDVGIPLYRSLLFGPTLSEVQHSPIETYCVRPEGTNRYQVERVNHPKKYVFNFIDSLVTEQAYMLATIQDYSETGLFLNRVIISKVVEGRIWRFDSEERPHRLTVFDKGIVQSSVLPVDRLSQHLGHLFDMEKDYIELALQIILA